MKAYVVGTHQKHLKTLLMSKTTYAFLDPRNKNNISTFQFKKSTLCGAMHALNENWDQPVQTAQSYQSFAMYSVDSKQPQASSCR